MGDWWNCQGCNFTEFYNSPRFSDATIKCGDREIKVHKIILGSKSRFFSTAFNGKWRESNGVISLEDDELPIVRAMLRFMYTSTYNDGSNRPSRDVHDYSASAIPFNIKVYDIADKYDIPTLKRLAVGKFESALIHSCDKDEFIDAIIDTYDSTSLKDQDLRDVVVRITCQNIISLVERQEFCQVLEGITGFAADIAKFQANEKKQQGYLHHCGHRCGRCNHDRGCS